MTLGQEVPKCLSKGLDYARVPSKVRAGHFPLSEGVGAGLRGSPVSTISFLCQSHCLL